MKVEVYSKDVCPHCVRAKKLLDSRGIEYTEINAVENKDALIQRITDATGSSPVRLTAPQIFIDDKHVGGADELTRFFKAA